MSNKLPTKGDEYQCLLCGGVFIATKNRNECIAECEILVDHEVDTNSLVVVCSDCNKEFMKWFETLSPQEKQQIKKEYENEQRT